MKYRGLAIVAIALLVVGCCRLDQQATLANLKNVVKISCESDASIDESDSPSSLKMAARARNEEARNLAREMALSAGNDEAVVEATIEEMTPDAVGDEEDVPETDAGVE